MKRSRLNGGFTLAEVLITLVIIGVIAALTVPALIQNTQKQEYVSALKKAYSTLSQVTQQIIAEEGNPKTWSVSASALYNTYKEKLRTAKDCGGASGCFSGSEYKNLLNQTWSVNWNNKYNLILSDGMQFSFPNQFTFGNCNNSHDDMENFCANIIVDINGSKKPNQIGRDVFWFVLKENGLYPRGCDKDGWCSGPNDKRGYGCACKVIQEGAMNY